MCRAVIYYKNGNQIQGVNIEADRFNQTTSHLIVCKGGAIVGAIAWEVLISSYISERTEK